MSWLKKYESEEPDYSNVEMKSGGLIKRADGSYSKRGLWDNIRANKGSGKKPTKEMLEQERKIKAKMEYGGPIKEDPTKPYHPVNNPDGYREPIYVDPNDPIGMKNYRNYNDSLNLFKAYEFQKQNYKPGYEAWLKDVGKNYPGGIEALRKDREKNIGKPLSKQFFDKESKKSHYKPSRPDSEYDSLYPEEQPIINYYKLLVGNDKNYRIGIHNSPDLWHKNIAPIGSYYDGASSPIYKKPVQPYKLLERETLTPVTNIESVGINTGSYEPTLMFDNLPRVSYVPDEPQPSKIHPYTYHAGNKSWAASKGKPLGYGDDGEKIELYADDWNKLYGTNYPVVEPKKKKALGGPIQGGPVNPIYVTDKNDPRLRAYNDSLSLHRQYYTDLDALRAELAEDDRIINRIGSLPFNRYSYQSNYASDPIKPESIVGFRSPEIDYTWQIPYYRKPVQPVVYRKPATVSPTGTVRSVPVETVAPVLPKRETLLPIFTDVVPMQTAGSYSEPTLMPDNLPKVAYKADESRASIMYPYSAAANLAAMNKPVGYGKDTDGTEVEFSAKEWDKMKGTKYSEFNKPKEKALGGWLQSYEEGGPINPEPPVFGGTLRPVEILGERYKQEPRSSTYVNINPIVSSLEEGRKLAFKDIVNKSIQAAQQDRAAQKLQLQKDLYNQRAETNALTKAGKQVTDFGTSLATAPKRIANTVFTAVTPDVINDTPQSYAQRVYDAATISDEDLWKGRIGTPLDKAGMIAEGASELALATMPLPSIKNIKTGAGMLADDIVNSPRLSMALQNPEKRLMNPEAYKTLTKESSGIRGKIADYYFKNKQKNIYSEIENIREKVYRARKMGQDDLADSYLDEMSELQQKLLEEVIPQESQWRLNYSGLPITPAKMAGGQGTIYKNNMNPEELIKVGSYMGDEESLNNLIKVGKNYKNPDVVAAFPTKAVPYKMGKENLQAAQFMPKLNYEETFPDITPQKIKNYLNEFDKMGVGIDYAGAGNIGSVDNKLGLVDLTYVGTPNNRNRHYFLRERVFNPVYRNNSGLERFQYDADDWVNLKNNKKQMGGWLNKYN